MRKGSAARELPPKLEMECLRVLWQSGEGNVKSVQEALAPERPLAYTTVMTVLDRLARRGCVQRRKTGRSFVYAPLLTEECVREVAVKELVDEFFAGSIAELQAYLGQQQAPVLTLAASAEGSPSDPRLDTSLL